jgi:fructose/tagatose bisphosphate aldolase
MPLENMKAMLSKAAAEGYAVGAFNILDYNSIKAVVRAAEEANAPVIIQTSAKTVTFWGAAAIISWVRELVGLSNPPEVGMIKAGLRRAQSSRGAGPIALHLDHCKD